MSAGNLLNGRQFPGMTQEELHAHLQREFHPLEVDAPTVRHPRSGYQARAGIFRGVAKSTSPRRGKKNGPLCST